MMEFLFSYGTLQKEKVQIELFGRKLHGLNDKLTGYRIGTIEIMDESVLSKSEQRHHLIAIATGSTSDVVEGVVLELSDKELVIADSYETADYKRVKEMLQSGKESWVYVAV